MQTKTLNFVCVVEENTKLRAFVYIFHINRQASETVYPTETGRQIFRKPNLYEC